MPTSASPPARKGFDYASLDAETTQFIQQQTGEIRMLMKRTAQGIVEIGQRLIEVKEKLGHGKFEDWLEAEFDWTQMTATRFMNVAKQFKSHNLLDWSVAPSALYILAAPSTSKAVREEAIARAQAGEPITYTTAKALKQKYAKPSNKVKPEPEPEPELEVEIFLPLQASSTPEPLPTLGPKPEIVAIRRGSEPIQSAQSFSNPQLSVREPEPPETWWQLGGKHLLYCGEPNSIEFLDRITQKVSLLLAFPPIPDWLPTIGANTRIIVNELLPQGRNLDQLDETLESAVLFHSNLGDLVVSCFLPEPGILSIINRLGRRGMFAEPDSRRCHAVISDWKRAGLKAERLS